MSRESWRGEVFERLYAADPDPWGFDSSPYEAGKYAETLALLGERRHRSGLELGCANGAMTVRLAQRCDRLLSLDIAPAAIALARARCAGIDTVGFATARLPDDFDAVAKGRFDLVVISEILYFLCAADIDRLCRRVLRVLAPGGVILLANWTGATDTPCTGDEAADRFLAGATGQAGLVAHHARHPGYRLDRLTCTEPWLTV